MNAWDVIGGVMVVGVLVLVVFQVTAFVTMYRHARALSWSRWRSIQAASVVTQGTISVCPRCLRIRDEGV